MTEWLNDSIHWNEGGDDSEDSKKWSVWNEKYVVDDVRDVDKELYVDSYRVKWERRECRDRGSRSCRDWWDRSYVLSIVLMNLIIQIMNQLLISGFIHMHSSDNVFNLHVIVDCEWIPSKRTWDRW